MDYAPIPIDELFEEPKRPAFAREIAAGLGAGQVAGLAMAATLMAIFSVFFGKSPFSPLEAIGASLLGEPAARGLDVPTLVAGVFVHQFGPSLLWGGAFGLVVWVCKPRRSMALMGFGLLIGALAQIVDVNVLLPLLSGRWAGQLPILQPLQHENLWAEHVPAAASWMGHLVFGVALSIYPWKYDPSVGAFD